ncbi:MAG TPA: cellulase family glycosylhydrolase [Streptosporangiaceae bacterium]|nr:cellulase family glycosylhydrolase [Streptosporangiaceae bacterium]
MIRPGLITGLLCASLLAGCGGSGASTAPGLHVSGSKLVTAGGKQVVLHGVNRSGGEWACVQGVGIWDGPMGQASVSAMKRWHVNAVRVPLNEACWNGQSYVKPAYRGASYQQAVEAYVRLLNHNGLVAILDLSYTDGRYTGGPTACTSWRAVCQKPMPDAAQAIPFWTSVARTFKGNDAVIFDLFNEPYPDRAGGTPDQAWRCWLRGGSTCTGISYRVAGMRSLVTAVRSTGANNVIMLPGLRWSNDLTQWLAHEPADPDHNLAASWHSYNFNACRTAACWDQQIAPVIARVPVIVAEMGENDCAGTYIGPLMRWLDARSTSYLAWAWNADFGCAAGPGLITSYRGAATGYGAGYRAHLRSLK